MRAFLYLLVALLFVAAGSYLALEYARGNNIPLPAWIESWGRRISSMQPGAGGPAVAAPATAAGAAQQIISARLPSASGAPYIRSVRALDDAARTHWMVLVNNPLAQPVPVKDLIIAGKPLAEHLAMDPKDRYNFGKTIDWFQARPAMIPAGGATMLMLGGMVRELRQSPFDLQMVGASDTYKLKTPQAVIESLRVAAYAFTPDFKRLTLMIRNDGPAPAAVRAIEFNGQAMAAAVKGALIPPGMLAVAEMDISNPPKLGQDCQVFIQGEGNQQATAWFRAYPAETLLYPFWGSQCDPRELAAKNMDVYVNRSEAGGHIDREWKDFPDSARPRYAAQARKFGQDPQAWAWYVMDDAAWGKPPPQVAMIFSDFLRTNGSPQAQFLCLPADLERYCWTHDIYMNYSYHCTHQVWDPTVWTGGRDINLLRRLNEPAPILYLVDTVGQSVRWITMAEEELASYAMLGRGAKHLGWFLLPSVWNQGKNKDGNDLGGGIDDLETRPMRYQEGALANAQIWNLVGNMAAVFKTLAPWIAVSAKLPETFDDRWIETLPLLCKDDVILTTVLNRRQRCAYPRDYPGKTQAGGIKLVPWRDIAIEHVLPAWIHPKAVLVYDHDRGLRERPFTEENGRIRVQLDALDTAALLIIVPDSARKESMAAALAEVVRPTEGGGPIQPDGVQPATPLPDRKWVSPDRAWRARIDFPGPVNPGAWIKAALPAEDFDPARPIGYFDPASVQIFAGTQRLDAVVDYVHALGGGSLWVPEAGPDVQVQNAGDFTTIAGTMADGKYRMLNFAGDLRADYDICEVYATVNGYFPFSVSYRALVGGKWVDHTRGNIGHIFGAAVWHESEVVPFQTNGMPLTRLFWQGIALKNEAEFAAKGKPADTNWTARYPPRLDSQVRTGVYRFGPARQVKSRPDVYVRLPVAIPAGRTARLTAYWNYRSRPDWTAQELKDKPAQAVAAACGPREGLGLRSIQPDGLTATGLKTLTVATDARAAACWLDARSGDGALLTATNLMSSDGVLWRLDSACAWPTGAVQVAVLTASAEGFVTKTFLFNPPSEARLTPFARVGGRVESMAAAPDGSWIMAGADSVYGIQAAGGLKWRVPAPAGMMQADNFGPAQSVAKVQIAPDGQTAMFWSFSWSENERRYVSNMVTVVRTDNGGVLHRIPCDPASMISLPLSGVLACPFGYQPDGALRLPLPGMDKTVWADILPIGGGKKDLPASYDSTATLQSNADFRVTMGRYSGRGFALCQGGTKLADLDLPPYTLHTRLTSDGRVLAATTQGQLKLFDSSGKALWDIRRPARIDGVEILPARDLLVAAYKEYPNRYNWLCRPVLEFIRLKDGQPVKRLVGNYFDDLGHYGSNLALALDGRGKQVFVGTPTGEIYRFDMAQLGTRPAQ